MVLGWLVSSSVSSPAPGSFLDFCELLAEIAGRMFFHFCDRFLSRPSFPFFFSAISFLLPSVLSWYSWFLRSSVLSLIYPVSSDPSPLCYGYLSMEVRDQRYQMVRISSTSVGMITPGEVT